MRKERYNQKLNELKDRIKFLKDNIVQKNKFIENRLLKKALYKEFQEAAEIATDIVAMVVKDSGRSVEDDYTNIKMAADLLSFDHKIYNGLKKVNGLRNVITHEYNGIDDLLAYKSMTSAIDIIEKFIKVIEKWLAIKR